MDTYKPNYPSQPEPKTSAADSEEAKTAAPAAAQVRDEQRDGELRPHFLKTKVVSRANGSAYVEVESTKVICSIYGPRQLKQSGFKEQGQFVCDFRFSPFGKSRRQQAGPQTAQERELSSLVESALSVSIQLEKFPKSVIEAHVMVLEDGGGMMGAVITCVSLALADAGVDLFNLVAACDVGRSGLRCLVGPSNAEMLHRDYQATILIAYMPVLRQITYVSQTGTLDFEVASEMIELCTDACSQLYSLMRRCLLDAANSVITES
eukprot:gb/GEZN01015958.1/.p1 GENE.gb/GEZN01015958.1/~~gb/GEZN01015958.1/.p1  ORF type:complete len:264 (+),score=30.45 gb/GEZN01015958.1/:79-870(+)